MTIDLNAHQKGVIIRLSMKEDCAAVAADHHKRERRGIPRAVFEPSPDRTSSRPQLNTHAWPLFNDRMPSLF
jgi:hypothetical protein